VAATASDVAARDRNTPASNVAAAKVTAAKVTATNVTATNVTATKMAAATAMSPATAMPPATASKSFCLYRAHSQSDDRNDDSNLPQHDILLPRRSCVPVLVVAGTLLKMAR
jgi:hypothetical protein